VTQLWNRQRENELGTSNMAPLHRDLLKKARKGVLTEAAFGWIVALFVEVDERLHDGQNSPGSVL
jgi:hypothetical protein